MSGKIMRHSVLELGGDPVSGKRKLACLFSFCVPDEALEKPYVFPIVEPETEVLRLSQTIRSVDDKEVSGRTAVIVQNRNISRKNSRRDVRVYNLGLKTWEVLLTVEAFKVLEESCSSVVTDIGGFPKYERVVRKLRNSVANESGLFGKTLGEVAFWPLTLDFGIFRSSVVRLRDRMSPSAVKVPRLLESAATLFDDVLTEVLSRLEKESPGIDESLINESIRIVKRGDCSRILVDQFSKLARMKSVQNQNAHPFGGGGAMAESMELYDDIVRDDTCDFRELGGLCLFSLHIRRKSFEDKEEKNVSKCDYSCDEELDDLETEPVSPTESEDWEAELEADELNKKLAFTL